MLDDHAGGHGELFHKPPRGREVVQIVEGERPTADLPDTREHVPAEARLRVVGGALMRVLAIGEVHDLLERHDQRLRERLPVGEPGRDSGLVPGRIRERLSRQRPARALGQRALLTELVEDKPVLLRRGDRRDMQEVLRGCPQHGRAPDVDHLDRLLLASVLAVRDLLERVEVDADEIERLDLVLVKRTDILRMITPREDARVDARVQGLHTPTEQLRRRGDVGYLRHLTAVLLQHSRGATARDQLDPEIREPLREDIETGLVVDRDQGPSHHASERR